MKAKNLLAGLVTIGMIFSSSPMAVYAKGKAKGKVVSVQVTNLPAKTLTLKKGKSKKLKVKVTVKNKASKKLVWKTSKKKILSVKNGTVKALKKGKAKVTITSVFDKKKKTVINVTVGTPVTKIKVNYATLSLKKGESKQLKATVSPKKASNKKVIWQTSNKKVATVNNNGKVKTIETGNATIKAVAADGSGKYAKTKIVVSETKKETQGDQPTTPTPTPTPTPSPNNQDTKKETKKYKVSFDTNGGSSVAAQEAAEQTKATKPTDPTKTGYAFDGWYTDKELSKAYDFDTAVNRDFTLYAKWSTFALHAQKTTAVVKNAQAQSDDDDDDTEATDSGVKLYLETSLKVDSIALRYGKGNDLNEEVTMSDSGQDSDDIAGDGIYTAWVDPEIKEDTNVTFEARYNQNKSNTVDVMCYTPLTEEDNKAINTVSEAGKDLVNDSDFQKKTETEKVEKSVDLLNGYANQDLVKKNSIKVDKDNDVISFTYQSGVLGGLKYGEFDEKKNGSTRQRRVIRKRHARKNASNEETEESDDEENDDSEDGDDTEKPETAEIGNAVILNSFPGFETEESEIEYRTGYYENLKSDWDSEGLKTTLKVNPTLEDYKKLGKYDVVCISTHGSTYTLFDDDGDEESVPAICLSEEASSYKNSDYSAELKSKQIVIADGEYWILSSFFDDQYKEDDLSNSFIFSECCDALGEGKGDEASIYDYTMANAFTGKSAKAYIGFHNSVDSDYSREFMAAYFKKLISGSTSKESYESAIDEEGKNDAVYLSNHGTNVDGYDQLTGIAYPAIKGNESAKLLDYSDFENGSFEDFNSYSTAPTSWKCLGDVRTLTQIGPVAPTHLDRMAIISTGIGSQENEDFGNGTEGSKLSQSFKIPEGTTKITFDYNFISEEPMEYVGSEYNDSFQVQLVQQNKFLYNNVLESVNTSEWKDISDVDFYGGDDTAYQTGWKKGEIDVSNYGGQVVNLKFIVFDVGDEIYDSACVIDHVQFQ